VITNLQEVDNYNSDRYNQIIKQETEEITMPVPLAVNTHDSLKEVLTKLIGNRVELALRSERSYSGKLTMVGDSVAIVSELAGKEFYDAVIALSDIVAVEVRVRDR
jgi:hypothetical protein